MEDTLEALMESSQSKLLFLPILKEFFKDFQNEVMQDT